MPARSTLRLLAGSSVTVLSEATVRRRRPPTEPVRVLEPFEALVPSMKRSSSAWRAYAGALTLFFVRSMVMVLPESVASMPTLGVSEAASLVTRSESPVPAEPSKEAAAAPIELPKRVCSPSTSLTD